MTDEKEKKAMKYLNIISDKDMTCKKMSELTGLPIKTVYSYRKYLMKKDIIEPKNYRITDDEFISFINHPMSYEGFAEKTGIPYKTVLSKIRSLKQKGRIMTLRTPATGQRNKYKRRDLLGDLPNSFIYIKGQEKELADIIKIHLSEERHEDKYLKRALTHHLRDLPKDIRDKLIY